MDAKQLRIGNFVYKQNSKLLKQQSGERDFIYKIENINLQSALKYDPIPLTEEWIKKFNLKLFSFLEIYGDNERGFHIDIYNEWIFIKYVHQLQNIYFALTGEELILNESL